MAGDWMQIDCDLPEKAEVVNIVCETGETLDTVLGRLVRFWRWVEKHFSCALLCGANVRTVSALCGGDEQFWKKVEDQKWIRFTENGVEIPGWKKRFSKSSKRRALDAKRKSANRRQAADEKRTPTGARRDETRRDENRGEKNIKPVLGRAGAGLLQATADTLRDTAELMRRIEGESHRTKPLVSASDEDRIRVLAAAERAIEVGERPAALFVQIVKGAKWDVLSAEQEQRASKRLREFRAGANGTT